MLSPAESPVTGASAAARKRYARIPEVLDVPNLIKVQLDSFHWFIEKGLRELFDEISPIEDFTGTGMELRFGDYEFGEPKYTEVECRDADMTFAGRCASTSSSWSRRRARSRARAVHGRLPAHDGQRHLRHQRRRARRRLAARPLARRLLHRREDPTTGRMLVQRQADPEPRRLAGVRDDQQGRALGQGRPQAQDPGHDAAARHRLRDQRRDLRALFTAVDTDPDHPYIATTLEKDVTADAGRGAPRVLQAAAPGRPADR